jgi:hypothetical protein
MRVKKRLKKVPRYLVNSTYTNLFCESNKFRNNIGLQKSILIFSNPRGGSTWLAELFRTLPKSAIIWEPLLKGRLKEFNDLNFFWHQPIPENADWPQAKEAFRKLLNLEIKSRQIYNRENQLRLPFSNYFIFKFCFGNMLMPWLVNNFKVNPILLLRHPCAVVSSQMKHGYWDVVKKGPLVYEIPDFPFNETYLLYKDVINHVKNFEEHLAATWSYTMVSTVLNPNNDKKWITLSYESLYKNFDIEIERIFERLNIDIPPKIYDRKTKASFVTKDHSIYQLTSGNQLNSWRNHLSDKQIKNILKMVNEFGISFYDESLEPDYNQIYVKRKPDFNKK